jgi:hypothetical protein
MKSTKKNGQRHPPYSKQQNKIAIKAAEQRPVKKDRERQCLSFSLNGGHSWPGITQVLFPAA